MIDYRSILEKKMFENEGSKPGVMLELVLAVAKFKNIKALEQDLDEKEKLEIQKRVRRALNSVYMLNIKGEDFVSCLQVAVYFYNSRIRMADEAYLAIDDVRKITGEIDGHFGKNSGNFPLNFVNAYRKYVSLMEKARFGSLSAIETKSLKNAKLDLVGNIYNLQELNISLPVVVRSLVDAINESNKEEYIPPFTNMPAVEARVISVAKQYLFPGEVLKNDRAFNNSIMEIITNNYMVDLYLKGAEKNAVHKKLIKIEEDSLKRRIHRLKTDYPNEQLVKEGFAINCDYFNERCIARGEKKVDYKTLIEMIYPSDDENSSGGEGKLLVRG